MQVLGSYVSNTMPLLELTKSVSKENLADYAIHVHGLKSSNRSIGAELLGAKAEALENAAKEGRLDFVLENNASFYEQIIKLLADLEDFLLKVSPENIKQKKDSPDPIILKKLLDACLEYDMDKADTAMAEIEAFEYTDKELVIWLRENIKLMNFKHIREKLESILS